MSLKDIREERTNLSQTEVARQLRWARTKYNKWENNNMKSFTIADIDALSDYFGVTRKEILKEMNVL